MTLEEKQKRLEMLCRSKFQPVQFIHKNTFKQSAWYDFDLSIHSDITSLLTIDYELRYKPKEPIIFYMAVNEHNAVYYSSTNKQLVLNYIDAYPDLASRFIETTEVFKHEP